MKLPYTDYSTYLSKHFQHKMQKIAVNAGFSCPNRDGTISTGGCAYCNNSSFSPDYCRQRLSVTSQLEEGKRFFSRKYPEMHYLAYFQAYTSTHGRSHDALMELYGEALTVDGVDGVIIATRPDCIDASLLNRIASLPWAMMEYGAESSHDSTLAAVNRGHTWAQTCHAVELTHAAGLPVGLHFIMGLPGETRAMMLHTIDRINRLPVDVVKFHQLQIIRDTLLAAQYAAGHSGVTTFSVEEYADLCAEIISRLRPDIAIERFVSQSPDNLLVAPRWGLKNYQFTNLLINRINGKENHLGS